MKATVNGKELVFRKPNLKDMLTLTGASVNPRKPNLTPDEQFIAMSELNKVIATVHDIVTTYDGQSPDYIPLDELNAIQEAIVGFMTGDDVKK